jgi:hypothetical protein
MRFIIHAIDWILRRCNGVFEFCDHPDCVFRVSVGLSKYPLRIPDGEMPVGTKVLELHFWNEHLPPMPSSGSFIGPAVKLRRRVASSTQRLAEAIENDPRLAGVRAVGGVTPLFTAGDNSPAEGIFRRLGFFVTAHQNPRGRFMEFWEEVYAWFLMWAFTPGNQNRRSLSGLKRSDFWISADDFLRLYGGQSTRTEVDDSDQGRAAQWWRKP